MAQSAMHQVPRDSASIVIVRDGSQGLEVLLVRRASQSPVLADTCVFPGGKLEVTDTTPEWSALLDTPSTRLCDELGEPALAPEQAIGLYVAAAREAAEESGLLFVDAPAGTRTDWCAALRSGTTFPDLLLQHACRLKVSALAPWSRWVTPRDAPVINRRFDTRFFLAQAPAGQEVAPDQFEISQAEWITPHAALTRYEERDITLIPPQIIGLLHLMQYQSADAALAAARTHRPPLIEPALLPRNGGMVMCYPGDPEHPVATPAFPAAVPTRLIMRERRFAPPEGFDALLHAH